MRAAAAVVVALAATAPSAIAKKPAPQPKPKPELAIEQSTITGAHGPFVFQGESQPLLDLEDTTRNLSDHTIVDTETAVYLEHGARHWLLGRRRIRDLFYGARSSGTDETVDTMDFPIGAYTVVFCAGAQHGYAAAARKGQCRKHGTLDFFVAAKRWTGSLSGTFTTALGNTEDWNSSNIGLYYTGYGGRGLFDYDFSGTVHWTDQGTDTDGCAYSGSGSKSFAGDSQPAGAFTVDYKHEEYNGGFAAPASFYAITISCPFDEDSFTARGPAAPSIFASHLGGHTPLPFGSTSLPGSPSVPAPGLSMSWNLRAAGP